MGNKRGPKFTDIDWDTFNKLCAMQCIKTEIANFMEISEDTIERAIKRQFNVNYAEYYQQKASKGRISLRRKQFDVAQSGNVTMLIWLGKQYLGQSDRIDDKRPIESSNDPEVLRIIADHLRALKGER